MDLSPAGQQSISSLGLIIDRKRFERPYVPRNIENVRDRWTRDCIDRTRVMSWDTYEGLFAENDMWRLINFLSDGAVEKGEIIAGVFDRNKTTGFLNHKAFILFSSPEMAEFYEYHWHKRFIARGHVKVERVQGSGTMPQKMFFDEYGYIIDQKQIFQARWGKDLMRGIRDLYMLDVEKMSLGYGSCTFCGQKGHVPSEKIQPEDIVFTCEYMDAVRRQGFPHSCQICGQANHWWTVCKNNEATRAFKDKKFVERYIDDDMNGRCARWVHYDTWMRNTGGGQRHYSRQTEKDEYELEAEQMRKLREKLDRVKLTRAPGKGKLSKQEADVARGGYKGGGEVSYDKGGKADVPARGWDRFRDVRGEYHGQRADEREEKIRHAQRRANKMCTDYFGRNGCSYGSRCRYSHSEEH